MASVQHGRIWLPLALDVLSLMPYQPAIKALLKDGSSMETLSKALLPIPVNKETEDQLGMLCCLDLTTPNHYFKLTAPSHDSTAKSLLKHCV